MRRRRRYVIVVVHKLFSSINIFCLIWTFTLSSCSLFAKDQTTDDIFVFDSMIPTVINDSANINIKYLGKPINARQPPHVRRINKKSPKQFINLSNLGKYLVNSTDYESWKKLKNTFLNLHVNEKNTHSKINSTGKNRFLNKIKNKIQSDTTKKISLRFVPTQTPLEEKKNLQPELKSINKRRKWVKAQENTIPTPIEKQSKIESWHQIQQILPNISKQALGNFPQHLYEKQWQAIRRQETDRLLATKPYYVYPQNPTKNSLRRETSRRRNTYEVETIKPLNSSKHEVINQLSEVWRRKRGSVQELTELHPTLYYAKTKHIKNRSKSVSPFEPTKSSSTPSLIHFGSDFGQPNLVNIKKLSFRGTSKHNLNQHSNFRQRFSQSKRNYTNTHKQGHKNKTNFSYHKNAFLYRGSGLLRSSKGVEIDTDQTLRPTNISSSITSSPKQIIVKSIGSQSRSPFPQRSLTYNTYLQREPNATFSIDTLKHLAQKKTTPTKTNAAIPSNNPLIVYPQIQPLATRRISAYAQYNNMGTFPQYFHKNNTKMTPANTKINPPKETRLKKKINAATMADILNQIKNLTAIVENMKQQIAQTTTSMVIETQPTTPMVIESQPITSMVIEKPIHVDSMKGNWDALTTTTSNWFTSTPMNRTDEKVSTMKENNTTDLVENAPFSSLINSDTHKNSRGGFSALIGISEKKDSLPSGSESKLSKSEDLLDYISNIESDDDLLQMALKSFDKRSDMLRANEQIGFLKSGNNQDRMGKIPQNNFPLYTHESDSPWRQQNMRPPTQQHNTYERLNQPGKNFMFRPLLFKPSIQIPKVENNMAITQHRRIEHVTDHSTSSSIINGVKTRKFNLLGSKRAMAADMIGLSEGPDKKNDVEVIVYPAGHLFGLISPRTITTQTSFAPSPITQANKVEKDAQTTPPSVGLLSLLLRSAKDDVKFLANALKYMFQ